MVRAAVSGAIDYSRADPTDNRWRIKHRLSLLEMQRQEDQHMLEHLHRHWCAYLAHGALTEESFANVKKEAGDTLINLQDTIFPWNAKPKDEKVQESEKKEENSKIDAESQKMIEKFKIWRAGKTAEDGKA
jgi:hypothetical protein